ncbi:T9SS type A sorting domain-containing protein [Lishizhenia sp.]|uniref:T9SS type A sorting domain-containing protein n=1 Tax=Lishizhenia sp. TaxID=2497594 RepID=UPI00299D12B2|nr:T9SS type A sorting domain-containing protein [Lishizhenia sp.]MDX1445172.1 T9SS type A sorting domain-containing protein [Lishizhenia sp.]
MKKAFLPLLFSLLCGASLAQKSFGGTPESFNATAYKVLKKTDLVSLTKPNMSEVVAEDLEGDKRNYRVGINLPANLSMENAGNWYVQGDTRIWKLRIKVEDAQALGLYMDNYYIPEGGKLFAYNKNKAQVIGAFTSETPSLFAMEMIQGDEITIEYNQPLSVTEEAIFTIGEVVYFYRGVEDRIGVYREYDYIPAKADACQVNVACPEGDNHQDQINSVIQYTFSADGGSFVCSASLMANTSYDCAPLILTATHCGEKTQTSDFAQNVWYFNYQNPNCVPGATAPYQKPLFTAVGAIFRASSKNTWNVSNSNQVYGTDFTLCELTSNDVLPSNAYFNGWDARGPGATNGVGIHHPSGHDKKISTFNNSLTSSTYNGGLSGAHWRVVWSATQNGHGVTEGGSSGSPIFNEDGLVVGILSGGSSFCTATSNADLYGKLSVSWDPTGADSTGRLMDWLDPENTGIKRIIGIGNPCSDYLSTQVEEEAEQVKLFPNPSTGIFNLTNLSEGEKTIAVRDLNGRLVKELTTDATKVQFDLFNETSGVYMITIASEKGIQTMRLIKS